VAHTERYGGAWFRDAEGVAKIANDTENFTSRAVIINNGRPDELDMPAPIVARRRSLRTPRFTKSLVA